MNVAARRLDARFLLPDLAGTAMVLGDLPGISDSLAEAGLEEISLRGAGGACPDLVIATPDHIVRALAVGARAILLEGSATAVSVALATAEATGLETSCLFPLPGIEHQDLVMDLRQRTPAGYALKCWAPTGGRRSTWLKLVVVRRLVQTGRLPSMRARLGTAVAPKRAGSSVGLPAFLGAAANLGLVASDTGWFASFPPGPDRKRCAFVAFRPGASRPDALVKFARLPGVASQFDRDERGLALAGATGGCVAAAGQRLLARFEVEGHQASVETAATGSTLGVLLARPGTRRHKVALVEAVARWLLKMAGETAGMSEALGSERSRIAREVLPFWSLTSQGNDLTAGLAGVPAVFEHGDLSEGNVMFDDGRLALVDWELARFPGLPLWDLLYFALCALPLVDGATDDRERDGHFIALFEGRARSSHLLFGWLRSAVENLSLPPASVGPLATLCWLHWGELLHRIRREHGSTESPLPVERAAQIWLSHPGLGSGWARWRDPGRISSRATSSGLHRSHANGGSRSLWR
jgi:hypothetical protein